MFGERRVAEIVAANRFATAAEMSARLLEEVAQFAKGAPQEDDITVLLVRREMPAQSRSFARSFDAIPATVDFRREFFFAVFSRA